MTDWSAYPNFVNNEMLEYRSGSDINLGKFYTETKQLCQIEESHFDVEDTRAVYDTTVKWPPNSTIRVKFLDGDEWQHAWTQKIVNEEILPKIPESIRIEFVKRNEYADVKITFKFDGYGASLIGTRCKSVGQNSASMKLGVLDFPKSRMFEYNSKVYTVPKDVPEPINNSGSIFKHEFGHVFGKYHEHQNPINNPIQWDVNKVLKYYMTPPDPWNKQDILNNVVDRLPLNKADATPFDPLSIMMYTVDPDLTLNNVGFQKNDDYSELDLEWLKYHMTGTQSFWDKYHWHIIGLGVVVIIIIVLVIMNKKKKNRK
jgi:hypothetical protein